MSEREESHSTDVEEFSESGWKDRSDSSRISSNDSDGNEELGVQPYLYEPETNTEGNAKPYGVFYEITELSQTSDHIKKLNSTSAVIMKRFNVFMSQELTLSCKYSPFDILPFVLSSYLPPLGMGVVWTYKVLLSQETNPGVCKYMRIVC